MDLVAAEKLCRSLLQEHGLLKYRFEWGNMRVQVANCSTSPLNDNRAPQYRTGRVRFSRYYAAEYTEAQVKETMLHEIAHALASHDVNHGPEWKKIALSIGSNGKRCAGAEDAVDLTKYNKWISYCPNGHFRTKARRPTTRMPSCGKCSKTYNPAYLLKFVLNTPATLAKFESGILPNEVRATVTPITAKSIGKVKYSQPSALAAKTQGPASRKEEFDKGAAFINWD